MTLKKANLFLLKDKFVFGGVLIIKQELLINEKIRAREVQLIGENGEKFGVLS